MAAGLGFKTFTTGEVLTAADTNGYLMQGILVFASSAARASAVTSPQEGQYSYLKDTNALEYYDGAAWVGAPVGDITAVTAGKGLTGGGSSGDVTVSLATTAKGDLVAGSGASTAAVLTVGANDTVLTADSTANTGLKWAAAASSGSAQVAGKNAVINGDFLINQRAFTSNTTTGAYNFDRWLQQNSGGTFTVTPQTFTPGTAPVATYEGRTYVQGITASQSTAGHYAILTQRIEDVTRYAGTTVTISFFAKANTGTPKIGVELWQDYGTGGSPSTAGTVAQSSVTLTTSWARYSVTVAVPSLSGKTLGTTANTSYLELNLWTSAGSTYNTRASSIGIQNFTASIWGVQLEYASSATYFTTATGTLQGELAACQRYYFKIGGEIANQMTLRQGGYFDANYISFYCPYPVPMRTAPSITTTGSPSVYQSGTAYSGFTYNNTVGGQPSTQNQYITATKTSHGLTVNLSMVLDSVATTDFIGVSAEL